MPRRFGSMGIAAIFVFAWAVSSGAGHVQAQTSFPRFGIGYVANAPEMLGGASAYYVFPSMGGIGVYVDAKIDVESPAKEASFVAGLTASEAVNTVDGARFGDEANSWRSFSVALVKPISPSLMLYGGAGYAKRTRYEAYTEPSKELGLLGFFWVEAPDREKVTVNLLFGGIMRISSKLNLQTGIETAPFGFTVGASLRLPPR